MIITSPVGQYYSDPLNVKIETHYTRAAYGGVGRAKAFEVMRPLYILRCLEKKKVTINWFGRMPAEHIY